ncbi:hypothetical protein HanHA300_Chr09g0342581 [Helianthus annuus]|nr:hypothetical protein HanHA300_Chr09g0342581 [Helianthus annuus]
MSTRAPLRPGKRVGLGRDMGQNRSIIKRVVLVRVETGSGRNGHGSERFRVGSGQVFKHKLDTLNDIKAIM